MTRWLIACLFVSFVTIASALAVPQKTGQLADYYFSSGPYVNTTQNHKMTIRHTVAKKGADWLRLYFLPFKLSHGDFLRIYSKEDGAEIWMNQEALENWGFTSPYFNGNRVMVELHTAPKSKGNGFEIHQVEMGRRYKPIKTQSQCGPTDDRKPSFVSQASRFMITASSGAVYGCSSSMVGLTCGVTAGHCTDLAKKAGVVEFNVPNSDDSGKLKHPAPEHQYVMDLSTIVGSGGGLGKDYAVYEVKKNDKTQYWPGDVQGYYRVEKNAPKVGDVIRITGFGIDRDQKSRNQIEQTHTGKLTSGESRLQYVVDTEPGNSGSGVVDEKTGHLIATHTHGGCRTSGEGANSGTSVVKNENFAKAVDACLYQDAKIKRKKFVALLSERNKTVRIHLTNHGKTPIRQILIDLSKSGARFVALRKKSSSAGLKVRAKGLRTSVLKLDLSGMAQGQSVSFEAKILESKGSIRFERLASGRIKVKDIRGQKSELKIKGSKRSPGVLRASR